ncbi:hypothetical protein Tco_1105763 [Tanacetum coccineum]
MAQQQAAAFQALFDTLRAELQATRELLQNRQGAGVIKRELLVSKPTTLGDVFLLAQTIKVRFGEQAALVAGTSVRLEANKVVNDGDDSESSGPVTPTSGSESLGEVLVEGKQDEAKVVKVVVVADEQNSDEQDVLEGNEIIGNENNKGVDKEVQYYVYTLHVLIPFLGHLNDKYIKKKNIYAAMQRRLWEPGIKIIFFRHHFEDNVVFEGVESVTPMVRITIIVIMFRICVGVVLGYVFRIRIVMFHS